MKFRNAYSKKTEVDRKRWATENTEDSMTQQGDAHDSDINVIMAKYNQTGQIPQLLQQPLFDDFTDVPDYKTAVEMIRDAEAAFLEVPAAVRLRFGNDAGEFIKFTSNPENRPELEKLGLLKPKATPTIEEETLNALRDLKPKENDNGNRPK